MCAEHVRMLLVSVLEGRMLMLWDWLENFLAFGCLAPRGCQRERTLVDLPKQSSSSVKHYPEGDYWVCGFDGVIRTDSKLGAKNGENGCRSVEPPRKLEEGLKGSVKKWRTRDENQEVTGSQENQGRKKVRYWLQERVIHKRNNRRMETDASFRKYVKTKLMVAKN